MDFPFSHEQLVALRRGLCDRIIETPVVGWESRGTRELWGDAQIVLKLELFQRTGSFKVRGALAVAFSTDDESRARGFTTVSAGNHAIATAYAAKEVGSHAKVVMLKSANSFRQDACRQLGAEIVFAETGAKGFELAQRFAEEEGRTFIHPFDGKLTSLGSATLGAEICEQISGLDAIVVPIGGGGLCSGVAAAVKMYHPECKVYGVEPEGAATMKRSLEEGRPLAQPQIDTIADSLGAPFVGDYSFDLCRRFVDQVVLVSDDELRCAMRMMAEDQKLMVEPAGAAGVAAVTGRLRAQMQGKKVGIVVCGANIDVATFCHLAAGSQRRLESADQT